MSTIVSELARAKSAFEKPTLTLLHLKWAQVTLAVFASHFTREQPRLPADRFHVQVETALDTLRRRGESVPDNTARDLCRQWVNQRWLSLSATDEQVEEYALTSHAQEALDYVNRLSAERTPMFGESRIMTILEAARRCATEASPDRELRLARLDDQIDKLVAERTRIEAGGAVEAATDERMLDEYLNLHGLLAELPRDFMRVSESVKDIHRGIVSDFRAEQRTSGAVLDDYLARADQLMTGSPAGRAFTGAVELLRNEELLDALRSDLDAILDHGFTDALSPIEKTNLRKTVTAMLNGIESVLEERRRLTSTLRTHMSRHDPLRDRELDEALRQTQTQMAQWMEQAGPRSKVPLALGLSQVDVAHLRTRLYDPADHAPPPALTTPPAPDTDEAAFEDLRKQGGPTLAALLAAITDRLDNAPTVTTAEIFEALPTELRRPVEVLGLIHLAAGRDAADDGTTAPFETVRPDGKRRIFYAPQQVFTRPPAIATTEVPINPATSESTTPVEESFA